MTASNATTPTALPFTKAFAAALTLLLGFGLFLQPAHAQDAKQGTAADFFEAHSFENLSPKMQQRIRAFRERAAQINPPQYTPAQRRAQREELKRRQQRTPAEQAAFEAERAEKRQALQRKRRQWEQNALPRERSERKLEGGLGPAVAGTAAASTPAPQSTPFLSPMATPNAPIPDADPAGVSSTIFVPFGGNTTDLNVSLDINHAYMGDIVAVLEHIETGTIDTLVNRPGVAANPPFGCNGDSMDVTLDDEGTDGSIQTDCMSGGPAYTPGGSYTPAQPLSAFNDEDLRGNWVLTVIDGASGVEGVFESWRLNGSLSSVALVVNSGFTGFGEDNPGEGICDTGFTLPAGPKDDVPECTLLAAIQEANAIEGVVSDRGTIRFDIPSPDEGGYSEGYDSATDTWTIAPSDSLPAITKDSLTLDATTQTAGASGFDDAACGILPLGIPHRVKVMLDGAGLPGDAEGLLRVQAPADTVRGLAIGNSPNDGIYSSADGTVAECNYIGTEHDGATAAGNGENGAEFLGAGSALANSVTSANGFAGVFFDGVADGSITGNFVGTTADGNTALGNDGHGLDVFFGSTGNTIAENIISATAATGIHLEDSGTSGNSIMNNLIGLAFDFSPMGNDGNGILFEFNSPSDNNVTGNVIAHNSGAGVNVAEASITSIEVYDNAMFENDGLGIDLGDDGLTANDAGDGDDGANRLQNFPVIESAEYLGSSDEVTVTYSIDSDPSASGPGASVYPLLTDVYLTDADQEEGEVYLGLDTYEASEYSACGSPPCTVTATFDVSDLTDAFGNPVTVTRADSIVATATDLAFNTSEFTDEAKQLPVELAGISGQADGRDAVIEWETASESGSAGFYVEQEREDGSWQTVSPLIEGAGTSTEAQTYSYRVEDLGYGAHTFRLRQEDIDGSSQVFSGRPVNVEIQLSEEYALEGAYPNPFQHRATVEYAVQEAQSVTVELYNTLGQRVRVLHTGNVPGGETQKLTLRAGSLASGVYFVRMRGEDFATTQTITLVR